MGREKNKTIRLGFSYIALSAIFFFNANVNVIDVLPDVMGYVILLAAMTKLADLSDDIQTSLRFFKYMIFVEIGKLLALMWVFGLSRVDGQNTGILLISFVFAFLDSLLLFIAFRKLFEGLLALSYVHSNTYMLSSAKPNKKNYIEKAKAFTLFFVIFKPVMGLLPELTNLSTYQYDESKSGWVTIYEYIGLMRAMSFIIVLVVGCFWLRRFISFFKGLERDTELCDSLRASYVENILPKEALFIRRNIKMAFSAFLVAAFFMIDLRVDDFNLTPDFIGACIFMGAIFIMGKYLSPKIKKLCTVIFSVYAIVSFVAHIVEIWFFNKFYYGAVYRTMEAYNAYVAMCVVKTLSLLAFCASLVALGAVFFDVIENHTGFSLVLSCDSDRERIALHHKKQKQKLWLLFAGAALVVAGDIFQTFFTVRFEVASSLSMIVSLIFAIIMLKTTRDVLDEIETKYMLD